MAKALFFGILALGAAMVIAGDDFIEVPKKGAYSVTDYDVEKARLYARDLGWSKDNENLLVNMLSQNFGVRFENNGNNHFNITFISDVKTSNMEIEDGKELASPNIVGIPVKNKLSQTPKGLNIRQTYEDGKHSDLSWSFKPDKMIITHISNGHRAEIRLRKNDEFQG